MRRLVEIEEFKLTSRTVLRRGDRVKLSKGPVFRSESGVEIPLPLRGTFRITRLLQTKAGKTTFLEVQGLDERAGTFTVKIDGRPTKSNGVIWRPFRPRKLR